MIIKKYKKFLESTKTEQDMWNIIPDSVKDLHKLFQSSGKKLYLVGGSVRDFLTNDTPKDFDLATDALPDEVLEIVKGKYRTNLQGKAFGVVVVYTDEIPEGMEVATFREDISKGRNPEVKLGVTIEDDVKRRDITYNALFYDLDKKEIIDLTGGKADLESGITRMVGEPIERFDEDSLRILRAFRFASRYEHPLHKDTERAIEKRKQLENIDPETGDMKRISQERVWEEMTKAWKQAKDYRYYLNFFTKFDMWDQVFPGANINTELVDSKNFAVVISNLFKNESTSGLATKLIQEYKMDSCSDVTGVDNLVSKIIFLIDFLKFDTDKVFETFKKKQQCAIDDTTILEWLDVNNITDDYFIKFVEYKPSVSAKDLMLQGFKGSNLGKEIKRLEIEKFKNIL
jgi:tRNA nucleotidyltransferase/poly(A) polymerase